MERRNPSDYQEQALEYQEQEPVYDTPDFIAYEALDKFNNPDETPNFDRSGVLDAASRDKTAWGKALSDALEKPGEQDLGKVTRAMGFASDAVSERFYHIDRISHALEHQGQGDGEPNDQHGNTAREFVRSHGIHWKNDEVRINEEAGAISGIGKNLMTQGLMENDHQRVGLGLDFVQKGADWAEDRFKSNQGDYRWDSPANLRGSEWPITGEDADRVALNRMNKLGEFAREVTKDNQAATGEAIHYLAEVYLEKDLVHLRDRTTEQAKGTKGTNEDVAQALEYVTRQALDTWEAGSPAAEALEALRSMDPERVAAGYQGVEDAREAVSALAFAFRNGEPERYTNNPAAGPSDRRERTNRELLEWAEVSLEAMDERAEGQGNGGYITEVVRSTARRYLAGASEALQLACDEGREDDLPGWNSESERRYRIGNALAGLADPALIQGCLDEARTDPEWKMFNGERDIPPARRKRPS